MYIGSVKTYTDGKVVESCLALWPHCLRLTILVGDDISCPFEGVNDASDLHKTVLEVEFRCQAANVPPSYLPFKGAHIRGAFMVSVFLEV